MKKFVIFTIGAALLLSACTGTVSQETLSTQAVNESMSTQTSASAQATPYPGSMATVDATEVPGSDPGLASTGTVTYALIPEESTVTYEVAETFLDQANVLKIAIGKTSGVTGEFEANFTEPSSTTMGQLAVDISGLTSDSGRRDNAIRERFLQSNQYPTVTFVPTKIEGLPATYEQGVDYPITITGDLTIREVTLPAVFDTVIRLEDETLRGQATTTFLMSEYGFGPISIMGMLNTEDEVKITVDFVARPK